MHSAIFVLFWIKINALKVRQNVDNCADISLYQFLNSSTVCWKGICHKENFHTTGIVSMPGSGNSWVRHLIQMATGIHTGSVYEIEVGKRPKVFQYEGVQNASVIGIKDHLFDVERLNREW